MKKGSIYLIVILLVAVLAASCFACTKPSGGTKNPAEEAPKDTNSFGTEGYTLAEVTPENMLRDLIRSILVSGVNTASVASLKAVPTVSWQIEAEADVNGQKLHGVFSLNFDNNNRQNTVMDLNLSTDATQSVFRMTYFADSATTGQLYVSINSVNKMKIPLESNMLSTLFPISFGENGTAAATSDTLALTLGGVLRTSGKINYEYKDISGKRSRHYNFNIDLKATLIQVLETLSKSSETSVYIPDTKWIISNLFGVDANKLATSMPDANLNLDFITVGGTASDSDIGFGVGSLNSLKLGLDVAASDNADTLFRGKSYTSEIKISKFQTSRDFIQNIDESDFTGYYEYDQRAVALSGDFYYNSDPTVMYDVSLGFLYNGMTDEGAGDKLKLVISEKGEDGGDVFELYYTNQHLYMNCLDDGVEKSVDGAFDFDEFILGMESAVAERPNISLLKALTYVLGSVHVWEHKGVSYTFDARFFNELINIDIDALYTILQNAYGGDGTVRALFDNAGINLSDLIIDTTFTVIIDTTVEFLTVTDDVPGIPDNPEALSGLGQ